MLLIIIENFSASLLTCLASLFFKNIVNAGKSDFESVSTFYISACLSALVDVDKLTVERFNLINFCAQMELIRKVEFASRVATQSGTSTEL